MTAFARPKRLGPISRCAKCKTVTTLRACPCGGKLVPLTAAQADAYVERGHAAFDDAKPTRRNPSLILVAGNPRPPAEVERAWCKFHERDSFAGTVRNVGKIPGAPDYVFALGRCVDVDIGHGPQTFEPRPWLVYAPDDEALWIVMERGYRLGSGVAGATIRAVTYDPMASSGKDPAKYRHKFESPLPTFSPVGNPNYCRAVLFDGGNYRVDDWIRD